MAKFTVLQIGEDDWSLDVNLPETVEWYYLNVLTISTDLDTLLAFDQTDNNPFFDSVLITSPVSERLLEPLMDSIEAYTLFQDTGLHLQPTSDKGLFRRKILRTLDITGSQQEKVNFLILNSFKDQYGDKLWVSDMDVSPHFSGDIAYNGHVSLTFTGDFGEDFQPLFSYRYNFLNLQIATELWQEYHKEGQCDIQLEILCFATGTLGEITKVVIASEDEMKVPILLPPDETIRSYAVSVSARGNGQLSFGPLHKRHSRMGLGQFLLGGSSKSDALRQEVHYYFNPGDMKPPLTVYFAGFRPAEGFEAFYLMKSLQGPFLLLSDPRLEGGCFYMGSETYEDNVRQIITEALTYLNFTSKDLILTGISMGSYGALYNAAYFNPHAIVVSKPFTDIGKTVSRLKLKRPDDFESSADMIYNIMGASDEEALSGIKERFWTSFKQSTFANTSFAISYMLQDDYDDTATQELITHLADEDVLIYTKGYEGRHNDNTAAVVKWFTTQLKRILTTDFGRDL